MARMIYKCGGAPGIEEGWTQGHHGIRTQKGLKPVAGPLIGFRGAAARLLKPTSPLHVASRASYCEYVVMHGGQQMAAEADQPEIATSDTTGAETETLVCWQGDSVMRISRVSDSPILMYRGFEIGMAQSVSPLAPPARARCSRGEPLSIVNLPNDCQESMSHILLCTGIHVVCAAKFDD